jgi:hypothetical protein
VEIDRKIKTDTTKGLPGCSRVVVGPSRPADLVELMFGGNTSFSAFNFAVAVFDNGL